MPVVSPVISRVAGSVISPLLTSGTPPLILDGLSNVHSCYSPRKLRTAYTGSAIRVREDGGNTDADIGFDGNGNLDEVALASHVGENNGFIDTWYDQSGNSRDIKQQVGDTAQPALTLNSQNGHPTIDFDGSNDTLFRITSSDAVYDITNAVINWVGKVSSAAAADGIIYTESGSGNPFYQPTRVGATVANQAVYVRDDSGTPLLLDNGITAASYNGTMRVCSTLDAAGSMTFRVDGTQIDTASYTPGTLTITRADIGSYGSGGFGPLVKGELVIFNTIVMAELAVLEANQMSYWGV